ncbi:MAG TPA: DUF5020 family protein [Chitinophagaceae bacterium]|nr:DUF5020 family protein [Chitinophagaceae bacterium]
MKLVLVILLSAFSVHGGCQQLQLHYDLRHTVDPKHTKKNFPAFFFEYFRSPKPDSAYGIVKPGSFLLKAQSELSGERNNMGQYYVQVSQGFRFWKPKVYVQFQYNGGLGIAEPGAYGYYLTNAFSVGVAYSFQWRNKAFFNVYSSYKYTAFKKASHDNISAFFWLIFFSNYRINFTGNIVTLTENRDHGDAFTMMKLGKKFSVFSDPQIWLKVYQGLSVGSRVNMYYHLLTEDDRVQAYPSAALRYQF